MFEHYYSFFHYCLLCCRYVLQKSILRNQNGRHKQSLGGHGLPSPRNNSTEYKSTIERKKTDAKSFGQKADA